MKTSSISYRVADFLKQHVPFQFVDEADLLALAQGGRVKFHESGEYVLRQGAPRSEFVFVIQQGRIELLDESEGGEQLRDVLGPGDIVGFGRFLGAQQNLYTARTASDVLLYAFPGDDFDHMVARYPKAARYLAAYFSVSDKYDFRLGADSARSAAPLESAAAPWVLRAGAIEELAPPVVVTCRPEESIREAAGRLSDQNRSAAAVIDDKGSLAGYFTLEDLRDHVATGKTGVDEPVSRIMRANLPSARSGLPAGEYVVRMLRARSPVLAITENRTGENRLRALIGAREIALLAGANPAVLAGRFSRARSVDELAHLMERLEEQIRRGLTERVLIGWHLDVVSELQAIFFRRVVELAEEEARSAGVELPDLPACWMLFGSAARRELLTRFDFDYGVVYADPPRGLQQRASRAFQRVAERVVAALRRCGFQFSSTSIRADEGRWRQPLSAWKETYAGWIANPVGSRIYEARSFFEQRPAHGETALVGELRAHIRTELAAHPQFIELLANDSLANLPPLTFFEGLVVDDAGVERESLDLRRSTLFPATDVGRVLGLACGELDKVATIERFRRAARMFPEKRGLFEEAVDAVQLALYQRARAGLTEGSDGSVIHPGSLSKLDQQLLKVAFRTTLELLRFTSELYGLARR